MKIFKVFLSFVFLLIITTTSLGKDEKNEISYDIKSLIEKVKTAPPEEKYKYMNQLKIIIRNLHAEDRKKIMKQIVKELKGNKKEKIHKKEIIKHKIKRKEKFQKFNERNMNKDRLRAIKRKIREKRMERRNH